MSKSDLQEALREFFEKYPLKEKARLKIQESLPVEDYLVLYLLLHGFKIVAITE